MANAVRPQVENDSLRIGGDRRRGGGRSVCKNICVQLVVQQQVRIRLQAV